jgi:hypothetical protein
VRPRQPRRCARGRQSSVVASRACCAMQQQQLRVAARECRYSARAAGVMRSYAAARMRCAAGGMRVRARTRQRRDASGSALRRERVMPNMRGMPLFLHYAIDFRFPPRFSAFIFAAFIDFR